MKSILGCSLVLAVAVSLDHSLLVEHVSDLKKVCSHTTVSRVVFRVADLDQLILGSGKLASEIKACRSLDKKVFMSLDQAPFTHIDTNKNALEFHQKFLADNATLLKFDGAMVSLDTRWNQLDLYVRFSLQELVSLSPLKNIDILVPCDFNYDDILGLLRGIKSDRLVVSFGEKHCSANLSDWSKIRDELGTNLVLGFTGSLEAGFQEHYQAMVQSKLFIGDLFDMTSFYSLVPETVPNSKSTEPYIESS